MGYRDENAEAYCEHISALLKVNCTYLKIQPKVSLIQKDKKWFCFSCKNEFCKKHNTLLYGCSEAYRFHGKYEFFCPQGFFFVASCLCDEQSNLSGGMLIGPVVTSNVDEVLCATTDEKLIKMAKKLPVWNKDKIYHAKEILVAITKSICNVSFNFYGAFEYEQDKILSKLNQMKDRCKKTKTDSSFLFRSEKKLYRLIVSQDKEGAQKLLNELLGYIYFTGESDINTIKVRMIELLVQLSRAAIDAGAEAQEILLFNESSVKYIETISTIEELCIWISGIMHRFIQYSFDFTKVKHADVLYKIMQYVKANYHQKITLDDIASHVYLSRSYISSLFKEETGESLFTYINRVRVEKSKNLILDESVSLADVGAFCGFDDQSYFTKVFKNITGVSPKKYRDKRGNIS